MPSHTAMPKLLNDPEVRGALTGLTDTQQKPLVTYGVFQQQAQTPPNVENLQNIYGTAAMPSFQFVKMIQTGERTYDPNDTVQKELLDQYKEITDEQGTPPGMPEADQIIAGVASEVGQAVGRQAGRALVDPYLEGSAGSKILEGATSTFSSLPSQQVQSSISQGLKLTLAKNEFFQPELANAAVAKATGNLDTFNKLSDAAKVNAEGLISYDATKLPAGVSLQDGVLSGVGGNISASAITQGTKAPTYFQEVGRRLYGTEQAAQNWASAAGGGVVNFGVQLLMGEDPAKAAKSAGASAIGTAIGNALLPGIGGVVGGVLGGLVGGRVISNELMKQGLMTREQVLLDYRFTRDYLTTKHVNGYHCWAVWMVKQMRKGKFVKFWKHVAGHRANEIAYIYGKRDKPDYLGKIYRKVLEPTCWVIGNFKKSTDWSVLYKQKEI